MNVLKEKIYLVKLIWKIRYTFTLIPYGPYTIILNLMFIVFWENRLFGIILLQRQTDISYRRYRIFDDHTGSVWSLSHCVLYNLTVVGERCIYIFSAGFIVSLFIREIACSLSTDGVATTNLQYTHFSIGCQCGRVDVLCFSRVSC